MTAAAVAGDEDGDGIDEALILGALMAALRREDLRVAAESALAELDPDLFVRRGAIALAAILKESIGEEDAWTPSGVDERVAEMVDVDEESDAWLPEFVLDARGAAAAVPVRALFDTVLSGFDEIRRRRDRRG